MKRFLALTLLCAGLAACDDAPPDSSAPDNSGGGGGGTAGSSSGGGGGGQVRVGDEQSSRETITERYQSALEKIKTRDWDGARDDLTQALERSAGNPIEGDIRKHLQLVEQGILAQPPHTVASAFAGAASLFEKKISVRGILLGGGKVGQVTYYFWVQTGREKLQCRYPKLSLEDKKTILLLKDGAQVLVRGTLKSPWGTNPDPYLDLSYFRLEKLSAEQQAEMDKKKTQ